MTTAIHFQMHMHIDCADGINIDSGFVPDNHGAFFFADTGTGLKLPAVA
jgi:hypothetical protein